MQRTTFLSFGDRAGGLRAAVILRRILLVLLSAALHALAFPPFDVPGVAWISLVPLLWALRDVRAAAAAALGLLWGTAEIWGVGFWVPGAFAFYYQQPLWLGVAFAFGASVVFAGSYAAAFCACAAWMLRRTAGVWRALTIACLWVAWELARARLLTGDPWLLAGYALLPNAALRQAADLGGVYLLSFLLAFANASVFVALEATRARAAVKRLAPAAAMLLAAFVYGQVRLGAAIPDSPRERIVIVQGDNDLGAKWQQDFYGRGLAAYMRLTYEKGRPDHSLIVWPESALTFFLDQEPAYRWTIARMLKATGSDLLVGGPHRDGDESARRYFNSAFYMTSDGEIRGRYDKRHLLPFAEYFPLRTIELLRRHFQRVRYFTPGSPAKLLHTRIGNVAVAICFEAIFPDLIRQQMARGGELLVNLSNDAWLGAGAGPLQHLAMVRLRAVENRTWVVRSTTTGISAVIDPFGKVVARTPVFKPAVLAADVVPMRLTTVYERIGDAFAYACVFVAIVAFAIARRRRRESPRPVDTPAPNIWRRKAAPS